MSILSVENLTHIYGAGTTTAKAAIEDISFSLESGNVLGIIGHTGSGKSTLVSHLNGLLKPTSGKILINGKDIWENSKEIKKVRAQVGLVFQYPEYQLFEETVFEDIAFGPKNLGMKDEELSNTVLEAAALMHIREELLHKSPFDLSGGEKRRVAIAGVLAMRPQIVVFDEPTAGLDPIGRETIFKAIDDYRKKNNATVIIVSHSMEDIAAVSDKVMVLSRGKIVMFDETRKVFAQGKELKELGLDIPMITDVFLRFREQHPDFTEEPLTVDEGVRAMLAFLKKGGKV